VFPDRIAYLAIFCKIYSAYSGCADHLDAAIDQRFGKARIHREPQARNQSTADRQPRRCPEQADAEIREQAAGGDLDQYTTNNVDN
jgi:phage terminase small subunit